MEQIKIPISEDNVDYLQRVSFERDGYIALLSHIVRSSEPKADNGYFNHIMDCYKTSNLEFNCILEELLNLYFPNAKVGDSGKNRTAYVNFITRELIVNA